MNFSIWTGLGEASIATLCFASASNAQENDEFFDRSGVESVSEQSNPSYDQKPIPLGSFQFGPEAEFSAGLRSNTLAPPNNEVEDSYVGFTPAISLDSNWLRHALGAYIRVDQQEYSDLSDESRTNMKIELRGRLDLGKPSSV